MFAPTRYIAWARQFYGKVEYDLASSGIPGASWSELGVPAPSVDEPDAFAMLSKAIAYYNDVSPAEVTPALGTSHAIFLAYASILSPGDEILVEHPGYEPLTRAAEGLGATVRTFPRRIEDGYAIVPAHVAALVGPRTRAIVVTNLYNPAGVRADEAALRELAEIAEARGGYLVVDEVYAPFDGLPEDGVFRGSARSLAKNVVAIGSLTKCYGLGPHRIGWLLGPEEIAERAHHASISTLGHLPLSHAAFGAAALGSVGTLAKRAKTHLAGKRAIAERWARSIPNAHWSAPREGLFGLLTLPGRGDLLPRIEAHTKASGVLVGAGTFFGAPESFRLSWASCDVARFEEGLRRLAPLVA